MTQIAVDREGLVQKLLHNEENTKSRKVEALGPWEMCRIMLETPGDVERRTGLRDLKQLLCYTADGDVRRRTDFGI
jgi:hypothetical protein